MTFLLRLIGVFAPCPMILSINFEKHLKHHRIASHLNHWRLEGGVEAQTTCCTRTVGNTQVNKNKKNAKPINADNLGMKYQGQTNVCQILIKYNLLKYVSTLNNIFCPPDFSQTDKWEHFLQ